VIILARLEVLVAFHLCIVGTGDGIALAEQGAARGLAGVAGRPSTVREKVSPESKDSRSTVLSAARPPQADRIRALASATAALERREARMGTPARTVPPRVVPAPCAAGRHRRPRCSRFMHGGDGGAPPGWRPP
jgi:hypothetical protein